MRMVVTTPTAVVEDVADVRHVRAEDETGAFGILPGHADFVTILPISVLTWRAAEDREGFVLVWRGFLSVTGGDLVEVAARSAFRQDALSDLGETALAELIRSRSVEEETRTSDTPAPPRDHAPARVGAESRALRQVRASGPEGGGRLRGRGGSVGVRMTEEHNGDGEKLAEAIRTRQRRREKWQREGERPLWKNLSMVGALGWLVVLPTLIGVFAGRWLDGPGWGPACSSAAR